MDEEPRVRTRALIAIAAVVTVAGIGMLLAPSLYEVVDKGEDVRPYDSGVVYKIRVADSVTFYAAEESQPDMDAISGSVLVALTVASLITLLVLRTAGKDLRLRRFYALASLGFGLLAVDEFFAIHETIGHNLPLLTDLPGIERPDDALFTLLVIPAIVFVYAYRDILFGTRRLQWLFAGAFAAFALAAGSDIIGVSADEPLEVISGACILGGFASLIAGHLATCIVQPAAAGLKPSAPADTDAVPMGASSSN
jgi:hypothetical protein